MQGVLLVWWGVAYSKSLQKNSFERFWVMLITYTVVWWSGILKLKGNPHTEGTPGTIAVSICID